MGHSARITDFEERSSEVSNVFLAYHVPDGYRYVPGSPEKLEETLLNLMVDGKVKKVDFGIISSLTVVFPDVQVTLRDGGKLSGRYITPEYQNHPWRVNIYGVQYGPNGRIQEFERPFAEVKSIVFLTLRDAKPK
jgi:hypothetical protein